LLKIKSKEPKVLFTLLLLAIIFQILLLFSIKVIKDISILKGKKIIVKTVPVDPASLFRGNYINLNYEFSSINLGEIKCDEKIHFYKGEIIYVKLRRIDGEWKAVEIGKRVFRDLGREEIMLRGFVRGYPWGRHVNVRYGIESYFVPEKEAKILEEFAFRGGLKVRLSVDNKGYASVCEVFKERQIK